ncbi:hypothetical protein TGARI_257595 [Toxoplasma gondii ARI]|uniref:SET domain-containing protein n=1 Tax=Toxoplasma gondii ARI TaxID=1074872 RepID=A0A139Y3K9_TOXGO|nr:hypothetical protein TGARI_257595 [Toxoplasma gondii ARI]
MAKGCKMQISSCSPSPVLSSTSSSSSTSTSSSSSTSTSSAPSSPFSASSSPSFSASSSASSSLSFASRSALCASEGRRWPDSVSLSFSSPKSGLGLRARRLLREGETVFVDRASRGWFSPLFRQGSLHHFSTDFVFPAFCCHCSAPLPLRRRFSPAHATRERGSSNTHDGSSAERPARADGEAEEKADQVKEEARTAQERSASMTEQHLPSSLHKSACGDPASSFCSPPHSSSRPSRPLFPSTRSPSPSSSRPSCSRSPSPSSSRPSCSRSPSPSSSRPSCSRSPSPSSSGSSSLRRNSRNASDARSPPRKVSVRASSPNESQATNANGRGKEQETEASEKGDICRDLGRYVGGVRCWRWRRGCAQKFCSRKCRAEAEFLYHSRLCVGFSSAYVELLRLASEADNEYYVVAAKMFAGLCCMRNFSASARSRRQKQRESRPASGGRTACDAQEGPLQTNFRGEREAREDLQAARRLTPRSKRAPSGSTELNAKHRQRREENCETPRGARNSHGGSRESRGGERRQEREGGKEQGGTEEEERQGKNGEENREAWVFPWAGWHQRPWWDTMKMPRYAASSTSEGDAENSGEESGDESPSPSKVSTDVSSASREKPGALGTQNAEEYRHFYAAALAGAEEARRSLGLSNSRNSALSHTSSRSSPSSPISSRSSSRSSLSLLSPSSSSSSPSSRPSASRSRPCSLASSSPQRRTASREEKKETPRQQAGDGTALIRRQLQERGRGEAGESKSRDLRRSPSSGLKKKRTRRSEIQRKTRSRREEEAATESGCLRAMAHALICRGAKQAAEDAAHALLEETKQAKAARRSPERSGVPLLSLPPSLQEGNGADENVSEAELRAAEAEGAAKQGDDASKRDEGEDSQNDEREQAKRRATRAAANCSLEQFFRSQIRKQTREVLSVLAQLLPELSEAGILTLRNFSNVIGLIRMNATAYRVDHHDLASLLQAASAQKGETKKNERPGGEETKSPDSGERQANEAGSRARKRQELAASTRGRIEERRPREERRHSGDRARRRRGDRRGRKTSPDFHAQVAEYGCSSADLLPDRNSQTDLSSLCSVEGLALFPIQSCMNHACLPNCRWFLQETPLAGRDAHRAAGEGPRDKARRRKTKSRRTEELPGVPAAATSERTEEGKSSRGAEKGCVMQDTEDMEEETAHRGEDEEDACEVHSLHETRRVFSRIWPLTPSYFRLAIVACRAILPGEELSADYFRPCETRERRVFLEPGAGPPSLELSVLSPCLPEKAEPATDAVCGDPADDARAEEPPTANQSGCGVGEERPQTAETEESAEQEERGERENRRFQRMHNGEGGNGASGDRGSQLPTNGGLLALPPFLKNRYECMTHQYRFQCSCILCRDASAGWRLIQAGALTLEDCENFAREQKWKAAAEEEKREKLGSPVVR